MVALVDTIYMFRNEYLAHKDTELSDPGLAETALKDWANGDNKLKNVRCDDETWKGRLIEEDFKRLMFDVQDV